MRASSVWYPYKIHSARRLGQLILLCRLYASVYDNIFSQSRCPFRLLAMFNRVYLFFPLRGHKPPPTLHDGLNPHLCLQRHRFLVPLNVTFPDVALYAIDQLFLLSVPSFPYCTFKISEYDSLWQPPTAHSDERPRPQKSSRSQRRLNFFGLSRRHGSSDRLVSYAVPR